jgi:hypothetical protein
METLRELLEGKKGTLPDKKIHKPKVKEHLPVNKKREGENLETAESIVNLLAKAEEIVKQIPGEFIGNIGRGTARLMSAISPVEPVAITQSVQKPSNQASATIAQLLTYAIPNTPTRVAVSGISELGKSGDVIEALKAGAYAITPAGATRMEQALKGALQAFGIETIAQTTKSAVKGEEIKPEEIAVATLAGGLAGAVSKPLRTATRQTLKSGLHDVADEGRAEKVLKKWVEAVKKVEKKVKDKKELDKVIEQEIKDKNLKTGVKEYFNVKEKAKKKIEKLDKDKLEKAIQEQKRENEDLLDFVAKAKNVDKKKASEYLAYTSTRADITQNLDQALRVGEVKPPVRAGGKTQAFKETLEGKDVPFIDQSIAKWLGLGDRAPDTGNVIKAKAVADAIKEKFPELKKYKDTEILQGLYRLTRGSKPPTKSMIVEDVKKTQELYGYPARGKGEEFLASDKGFQSIADLSVKTTQRVMKGAPEDKAVFKIDLNKLGKDKQAEVRRLTEIFPDYVKEEEKGVITFYSFPANLFNKNIIKSLVKVFKDVPEWFKPSAYSQASRVLKDLRLGELEDVNALFKDNDKKLRILNLVISAGRRKGYTPEQALKLHAVMNGDILKTIKAMDYKLKPEKLDLTGKSKELYDAYIKLKNAYNLERPEEELLGKFEKLVLANLLGEKAKLTKKERLTLLTEYLANYYRTALLSNPSTHLKNVIGNTAMLVVKMLDDANEALINLLKRSKNRKVRQELIDNFKGYTRAVTEWGKFKAYKELLEQESKLDPDVATKNPVFKLLSTEDAIFKWALLNAESVRTGRPIEELILDQNIMQKISSYIFAQDEAFTKFMLEFVNKYPFMKFFFPFVRTPLNMTIEVFRRLGFSSRWDAREIAKRLTMLELIALTALASEEVKEKIGKIEGIGQAVESAGRLLEAYVSGDKIQQMKAWKEFKRNMQQSTTIGSVYKTLQILFNLDAERAVRNIARGMIPNIIRRQAIASYPYRVYEPTILDTIKASIPGLRQQLPVKKKYGEPVKYSIDTPLEALFSMYNEPEYTERQKKLRDIYQKIYWQRKRLEQLKKQLYRRAKK